MSFLDYMISQVESVVKGVLKLFLAGRSPMNGAVKPALQSEVRVKDEETGFAAGDVVAFDDGRDFCESVSREGRAGETGNPNLQMLHSECLPFCGVPTVLL